LIAAEERVVVACAQRAGVKVRRVRGRKREQVRRENQAYGEKRTAADKRTENAATPAEIQASKAGQ